MECEPFPSHYALRGQFNEADDGHGVGSLLTALVFILVPLLVSMNIVVLTTGLY